MLGTETLSGNLAIVAAAQVAPVGHSNFNALFKAAKMLAISEAHFLRLSKWYVWPTVEDAYAMKQAHIIESLPELIDIAIDGQYDSPGFSSELCAVSAIEGTTKQIVDFAVVHKSETKMFLAEWSSTV
uniref:Uncharacterized protein n=1 Tax=Acrobeloides nanus TaxID=290746 RepID=A0A914DEU7_9BILA